MEEQIDTSGIWEIIEKLELRVTQLELELKELIEITTKNDEKDTAAIDEK